MDDGKNTLVALGSNLDGQRLPSIVGIQQNGKPALVASRLYVHPEHPEWGAWMSVGGLWPAMKLTDAAGLSVLITRQVPASVAENAHATR